MQTALITTTIHVPKVLALYRKLGPDVKFFVAADENTPEDAINFCQYDVSNCQVLFIQDQQKWKCSELLGWRNDSRRNIALLAAVEWGADIIVSIDDDMIPLGLDFFERFEIMLSEPYSGLQVGQPGRWLDVGFQTTPCFPQRGLPHPGDFKGYAATIDVQIGATQGIILGTPDTDGRSLRADKRGVHSATDILRGGFVADLKAKVIFNSQITAFRRELAPCFAQFYKWQGRNTDILASLIMRRIMRDRELYTFFGPPTGFHARSERDPQKDIDAEAYGVAIIEKFQSILNFSILPPGTIIQQTRWLYESLAAADCFPALEVAHAFLDDMEKVL